MSDHPDTIPSNVWDSICIPKTVEHSVSYEPNIYVKQPYSDAQDSLNIMSTQKFMNQIDLRCDDHLMKYKEDTQATRYCSQCKIIVCDSCVIEFHNKHIDLAKTKIEDYFRKQKLDLEELRSKINTSIKYKVNITEINQTIETHFKLIESFFSRRKVHLEEMKSKIDHVIQEENAVFENMKEVIEVFYREEGYKRWERPLQENEDLWRRIQKFLKDWDGYTKTDKVRVWKNDQVLLFDAENEETSKLITAETEAFKGKSKTMEKKIDEIWKGWAYTEKINDFEKCVLHMKDAIIKSKESINKLKYDDVIAEKVEKVSQLRKDYHVDPPVLNDRAEYMDNSNTNQNDFQWMDSKSSVQKPFVNNNNNNNIIPGQLRSNNENLGQQVPLFNQQGDQLIANPFIPPQWINNNAYNGNIIPSSSQIPINQLVQEQQKQIESPRKSGLNNMEHSLPDYELFLWIKAKSNELIIYTPTVGFKTQKISLNSFESIGDYFDIFPENSKFVNLGSSLLLTGGYLNKHLTSNCYWIIVGKPLNQTESYEINIMPYGKMLQARERHNIIYLQNRKMVIACGGFFNNQSEYSDINQSNWSSLGAMNEPRGNATVAYISNRYIYVIGGYKILDKKQGGMYHGNCEFLDFDNKSLGWKQINFGDNTLKLSAMGVITWNENYIILCGGFDGEQYRKDIYKVNFNDKEKIVIEKMGKSLPMNCIFLHNSFVKIGDYAYNMELNQSIAEFSLNNWGFTTKPYMI